ncbi:MAG: tRNA (5-methylaminomethyl-2-thiouridylate)-methyltransferase, partial [Chitinophagaceae bacterium]
MNILTKTADGSNTLFNELIGEHYHSAHGALQESKHVFINAGLKYAIEQNEAKEISILEVGFGTGLNFILSFSHCEEQAVKLDYTGIEAYPLTRKVLDETGYSEYVSNDLWKKFIDKYDAAINHTQTLSSHCDLRIAHTKLDEFNTDK